MKGLLQRIVRSMVKLSLVFVSFSQVTMAVVLFDNGGPNFFSGHHSDFDSSNAIQVVQSAESFSVDDVLWQITSINWWGAYFSANTPALDQFSIRIFDLATNNKLFDQSLNSVTRVDTGFTLTRGNGQRSDAYEYFADLALDIILQPGEYIMSIINDTRADADDDWFWLTSSVRVGSFFYRSVDGDNWSVSSQNRDLAFNISGATLMLYEPETIVMLAMILLIVVLVSYQQRLHRKASSS